MNGRHEATPLSKAKILVVDDEEAVTRTIAQILQSFGCTTYELKSSASDAISYAACNPVDLIIMDFVFQKEKIDGSDAILQIQKNINVPVVYISGHSDSDIIEKITSTRSAWFLQKPFNRDELRITLELALFNHLQDSLHRSEKRYERIIESISDYIYTVKIKDHEAVETIHGAACKAITGYSRKEFAANPLLWYTIIPETEREMVKAHFSRMLRDASPEPIEHRIINKNGRMRWIRNTPVFYFNSSGELEAYDGIISDVTERKMAEEALIAQREALEDLVVQRTENLIEVNAQLTKTEAELRRQNERMLWDLQQAKLSQEIILPPRKLETGFLKIDYIYQPMDMVGGDFLSFTHFKNEESFSVFLGDVAGHGVSAALYTHSIKAIADRLPRALLNYPGIYLKELNNNFFHFVNGSPNALFVTGLYGCFSRDSSGKIFFTFANAGNQYPLIFRSSEKTIDEAVLSGTIMGHFQDLTYEEKAVHLDPHDRVFLYTDGVNETNNEDKQQLDTDGLKEILLSANLKNLTISDTLKEVMKLLNKFRGKMPVHDDIVVIGIEVI